MLTYAIEVELHSYIADPYWPEVEKVINIQKQSGMNRARSSANARKALEEYLRSEQMTLADYDKLVELSKRPFYTNGDGSSIVIPASKVAAMLVQTCDTARAAFRPCAPEQVRVAMRIGEWQTNARVEDAQIWERFAVVSSGTGAKLSNQRGLRRSYFIGAMPPDACTPTKPVVAKGGIDINETMVRPEVLEKALDYAGESIGIGASRKMGWGRFSVTRWEQIP